MVKYFPREIINFSSEWSFHIKICFVFVLKLCMKPHIISSQKLLVENYQISINNFPIEECQIHHLIGFFSKNLVIHIIFQSVILVLDSLELFGWQKQLVYLHFIQERCWKNVQVADGFPSFGIRRKETDYYRVEK